MGGAGVNVERTFEEIVGQLMESDPAELALARDKLVAYLQPRKPAGGIPRGWYIIRVELESGRGDDYKPSPGRDLLVSPNHTFRQLAELINACFARWDLGHLYVFRMEDGANIGIPDEELGHVDAARRKLGVRREDEVFEYEFDFGDGWTHRCTVMEVDVTPETTTVSARRGRSPCGAGGACPTSTGGRPQMARTKTTRMTMATATRKGSSPRWIPELEDLYFRNWRPVSPAHVRSL
ncbi:MAG: hypothetical protein WD186_03055 [Actinomycetota bacterium]